MRKVLIALVVLIIAVAAILGYAIYNIDSLVGPYKDQIIAQAENQIGRKIQVDRLNVNIWGGIGVRFQDFSISENPAFGTGNFVQAKNLQVNVKLLPLLQRKIEVSSIILNDPTISIVRNDKGVFNFATLSAPAEAASEGGQRAPAPPEGQPAGRQRESKAPAEKPAAASPPAPGAPESETGAPPQIPEFVVSQLRISNGQIKYADKRDKSSLELNKLDLTVRNFSLNEPFNVALAVALLEGEQNVNLESTIGPLGTPIEPDAIPIEARINITSLSFDSLQKALPEIGRQMPGDLTLSGGMEAKDFAVNGDMKAFSVAGTLDFSGAGIKFGDTFNKPEGVALRIATDANVQPANIDVRNLDLVLNNLKLAGKGQVRLADRTALDLTFDMKPTELQGWDQLVPALKDFELGGKVAANATVKGAVGGGAVPEINGKATLDNLTAKTPALAKPVEELSATIDFSGKSATLQQTSLRVGRTRMNASAKVQNFAPLSLSYEFSSPEVWLADFQPRPDDEVLKTVKSSGRVTNDKALSFEGTATSAQGSVAKFNYTNFKTDLDLKDPWLTIKTLELEALKGTINTTGKVQIKGESPQFSFDSRVRGLDITEYAGGTPGMPRFEGVINADVSASGRGKEWEAIKPTIVGKGQAEVVDGKLLEFNIAEQVLEGITGVPGLTSLISSRIRDKYPQIFKGETTEFEELNTAFNAAGGKANIEQLNLKARDYGVTGKGWIDFDGQTDVASLLSLSKELSSDLAGAAAPVRFLANDQGQVEIPFVLTGTMPNVRPRPNVAYLGEQMVNKGVSGLVERFIPGMGKPAAEGDTQTQGTEAKQESRSKGIMGIAEQMIPGFGGATGSKKKSEKTATTETTKPAATPTAEVESAPEATAKEEGEESQTPAGEAPAAQTPASETPSSQTAAKEAAGTQEKPKQEPSTEERVKDAIEQGLKLFGQ